jgi:hypothetical protein
VSFSVAEAASVEADAPVVPDCSELLLLLLHETKAAPQIISAAIKADALLYIFYLLHPKIVIVIIHYNTVYTYFQVYIKKVPEM